MEKHLRVNTSILDMISTKAEDIQLYDEIKINCSMCLTTRNARKLLSQGRIGINTSKVIEVGDDENIKVMSVNGMKIINANIEAPKEPTILVVNGGLLIQDCDKKKLDQYKLVCVNGGVVHPMSFDTSNFVTNGGFIPYPDGAILIAQGLELTNSFIKAAIPGATYFVQGIPSDLANIGNGLTNGMKNILKETGLKAIESIDLELLKNKNIHFYTGWVTTLEENAEALMQITTGYIGNTIIPAGYKIMQGGKLDMMAIRRFGKNIYVDGNLEIGVEDIDALNAVGQLYVNGDVRIHDSLADIFFNKCSKYGNLNVYKGEWMEIACPEYIIRTEFLEDMEDGVTFNVLGCDVEIPADISTELLSEKVHEIVLKDSNLTMNLKQQKALRKKIQNEDSNIIIREYAQVKKPEVEPTPEPTNFIETKVNCSYYKL